MKTFGFNLLQLASGAIGFQQATWLAFQSRVANARGIWESVYAAPVTISGSWQPVGESTIKDLGLDTAKKYYNFYTSNPIDNVQRGEAPDRLIYEGRTYEVVGHADWYTQNGWRGIMCVDVS